MHGPLRNAGWWLLLALLACAAYCTILADLFVSDDFTLVRAVRDSGPFAVWSGPHSLAPWFLRPLVSLSFFVDYRIWGTKAFGFHLTNLLFHATNAFMVQRIAVVLLRDRSAAMAAALVFLVMPAHAESVTWVSGRTDVIAATFGLGAFAAYLSYVEAGQPSQFALALLLLVMGMAAKESLLALPLVMLGHAAIAAGDRARRGLRLALTACAVIVPYLMVRRLAVGEWIGGYGPGTHLNHDPELLARNLRAYVTHVLGFGVAAHGVGPWSLVMRLSAGVLALMLLTILALGVTDEMRRRSDSLRTPMFLVVAFFISILPSINLAIVATGSEGERYLYLSSVWVAILLAALLRPAVERPLRIAVLVALIFACTGALASRNEDWHQASRLCRNIVDDLTAAPRRDAIYVLDMPDDLHDAYVFRNSVWEALTLLAPKVDLPAVYLVAYRRLRANTHPAHFERHGDDIALTLPGDGDDVFEYWNLHSPATSTYTLIAHAPRELAVHFTPTGSAAYYAFGDGHLQRIDDR
jgi:hypothetical protein